MIPAFCAQGDSRLPWLLYVGSYFTWRCPHLLCLALLCPHINLSELVLSVPIDCPHYWFSSVPLPTPIS